MIVAAKEFMAAEVRTHSQIDKIVLRLGREADVPEDSSLGMEKKRDRLGRLILAGAGAWFMWMWICAWR